MLQWNGGLKRVKRRRSQKTPLEVSGSEAGAEVSTNSRETWHGETAEKFCCTNRSVLEPTPREANLNVKMIGKNPFVRFHHFWSSGHGLQRWKWGTKSWQMIIFQYISLRWRARGLEERTNTLLLCTRFGTSWVLRELGCRCRCLTPSHRQPQQSSLQVSARWWWCCTSLNCMYRLLERKDYVSKREQKTFKVQCPQKVERFSRKSFNIQTRSKASRGAPTRGRI